jgi:Peptidase family M23
MRLALHNFAGSILAALCALALAYGQGWAAEPQLTPLAVDVLSPPAPVMGSDGRRHLVYELRIENRSGGAVDLKTIDVIDPANGAVLLELDRPEIAKRFALGGSRGAESADLGFAQFGVLFMHVALPAGEPAPRALNHRITGHVEKTNADFTMTGGVGLVFLFGRRPAVLGPPLLGAGYVAADGCCDSIRHVRALLTIDGRLALAQRFAIDWEQVDAEGRVVSGDPKALENYVIFGKSVLAVEDGTVIAGRNDLPEQIPGALPASIPLSEADGNYVMLDIGGAFVLYAHMQPGSVTVKAGDKVRRGEVLGKVGNSGNSQAPHLHLHVTETPSPMASNGLPYVFDAFTLTAVDRAGTADFDKAEATGSALTLTKVDPPQRLRNALPLDLSVVDFGP